MLGIDSSRLLTGTGQKWIGMGSNSVKNCKALRRSAGAALLALSAGHESSFRLTAPRLSAFEAIGNDGNMVKGEERM